MLYTRVLTYSERNLTRLRIWLVCHAYYHSFGSVELCRFGPRSVLKSTSITGIAEAANIEYVARNTTIPVPQIQDVFTIDQKTYIVMDYIKESEELTYSWTSLSAEQQKGIFKELKDYIEQMRALSPPNPGRLECADGSGLFDIRFGGRPFPTLDSVREFHTHLGHDLWTSLNNILRHGRGSKRRGSGCITRHSHTQTLHRGISLSARARLQPSSTGRRQGGVRNTVIIPAEQL